MLSWHSLNNNTVHLEIKIEGQMLLHYVMCSFVLKKQKVVIIINLLIYSENRTLCSDV